MRYAAEIRIVVKILYYTDINQQQRKSVFPLSQVSAGENFKILATSTAFWAMRLFAKMPL